MQGISKQFGSKMVLDNIDLTIKQGTIHAIIGENGAGKSTLMNILSGVLQHTRGTIEINGNSVIFKGPSDATACGIGMVYQHFMLVPQLQVWQNVFLGIEPTAALGKINKKAAIQLLNEAGNKYGIEINPEQITGKLTIGEQQRVEILKVMVRNAEYIIFDEPTAVLTLQEINKLLNSIKGLRDKGKTIIFISHKLDEVLRIADEITVLRHGIKIGTVQTKEVSASDLVAMMVGREVHIDGEPVSCPKGKPVLEIKELITPRSQFVAGLQRVSLTVNEGEVLGVAGVDGNGQVELVNAVLGFETVLEGTIKKDGEELTDKTYSAIRASHLSLIPPDRQKQGVIMDGSIIKNTVLGLENDKSYFDRVFINSEKIQNKVNNLMEQYNVSLPSINADISELSGGNQQKIILAREFGIKDSNLIIAVNPTRGLDIGAIEFVYEQMEIQKQEGKAILLVSTELSEIMRLSDRIAVLYKGECMGILLRAEATSEKIGELMMGLRGHEE